jgi:tetratricopeptide (TPR) repeat protein
MSRMQKDEARGAHAEGAQAGRPTASFWRSDWSIAVVLLLGTLLAYQKAWHAGLIWDDDAHLTRPGLRSLHGLARIWTEPGATQQYYPLLHSVFWLEHKLWGSAPSWYHLTNIFFHAGVAYLLFRLLRSLGVHGARLASALFALHPVCVESVAWISEQKNTLSALFCLAAALAYVRFDRDRRAAWYLLGTGLFALSLLSKSVTATLPAALLVVFWWKRGRISWGSDVRPLAPWLVLGAGSGAFTAWMERTYVGASGAAYGLGAAERVLVAGRAVWFYLGKLVWPADLVFIYPRWAVDCRNPLQYAFPAAALAAVVVLWLIRRRSRGPLAAALLFAGTLFPALGFINIYPFIYSFVADHFQYLAAAIMISAAVAAATQAAAVLPPRLLPAAKSAAFLVPVALGALTWRQCAMYSDMETLWRTTIARNPSCWMAYNNLAAELLKHDRLAEAVDDIQASLRFAPRNAAAYVNLGDVLAKEDRLSEAFSQYEKALELEPDNILAHNNFGSALLEAGRVADAMAQYNAALALKPDMAKARAGLGDAYLRSGRTREAIALLQGALEIDPDDVHALVNLGAASAQEGRPEQAISDFRRALEISPDFAAARINLGNALLQSGKNEDAIAQFERALDLDPRSSAAHNGLGFALLKAGRRDEAVAHFKKALEIDPENSGARRNLEDALRGR